MMDLEIGGSLEEVSADALVVGVRAGRDTDADGQWLIERLPWLGSAMDDADFTGKKGQLLTTAGGGEVPFRKVVLVGLGDAPVDPETVRRAAGSAAKSLSRLATIATTLQGSPGMAEAVGFGFTLGSYTFVKHKSEKKPSLIERLILIEGSDDQLSEARVGAVVAAGVGFARDLVNEPAIGMPPAALAEAAVQMAGEVGLSVRVLDEDGIAAERLGGLQGVAMGAENPARFVELRWEPEGATGFLAFVGKGIVFDSGGLSIKPAEAMERMKTDMSGAAAVFGAMRVIAELKVPVKVVAFAPLTENMPGGGALRPGDVLTIRNGKTIEVLNTDAEGRLVLADALVLAAEETPDLIVDMATLTGACIVALGERIAGLMGTDDAVERVSAAADAAGERVWRLPLPDDYRKDIDSDVADMKNTGGRYGGAITAAMLLKEFVGDAPWAHLDIAGPARTFTEADHYLTKGGTGFGVRTLVELARRTAAGA
jgi:leucyl aminopeptidase